MKTLTEEFKEMFHEGEQQFLLTPEADHVVVVKSAKENTYLYASRELSQGGIEDAEKFVQMLQSIDETEVKLIVCLFNGKHNINPSSQPFLEIPSYDFRKLLLAANAKNMEALIFLATIPGLFFKELKWTMHPKQWV